MKMFTVILLLGVYCGVPIVAETQQQIIFRDDFNDNRNGWGEWDQDNGVVKVDNGKYIFEHKKADGGWMSWISVIEIDQSKDFEIDATIKKVHGNNTVGIIWGVGDNNNFHEWGVHYNGWWYYGKYINGKWHEAKDWQKSNHIKRSSNTLSVKKVGDQLQFYINGKKSRWTAQFERFFGNGIGFVVYKKTKIEIDNIIIRYLPAKTPTPRPTARPLTPTPIPQEKRPNITLWLDKQCGASYKSGEKIILYFQASTDGYVTIYDIDAEGNASILFPNRHHSNNYIKEGETYTMPDKSYPYDLVIEGPEGIEYVSAVVSTDPYYNWDSNRGEPQWLHDWGLKEQKEKNISSSFSANFTSSSEYKNLPPELKEDRVKSVIRNFVISRQLREKIRSQFATRSLDNRNKAHGMTTCYFYIVPSQISDVKKTATPTPRPLTLIPTPTPQPPTPTPPPPTPTPPLPTPMPTPQPPTPTPRPPTPTPTPSRVQQLLREADNYFDKQWFLTPKTKNAFDVYKEILRIDPYNHHARDKLHEMMTKYEIWGDNNYKQTNYEKAKSYYERYLLIAEYVAELLGNSSITLESQRVQKRLYELEATPTPSPIPISAPTPSPNPSPTSSPAQMSQPIIPTPSSPTQGAGNIYAVIIGIGEYQDERLNLKFTVNDAQGFYNVLIDPRYRGVPEENIKLLLNQDATDRNIKRQIGRWLQRQAGRGDTVIIYYAGHGAVDEEGDAYWVTYNADIHDLYSTALRDSVIIDMLKRISSDRVITFLDACHGAATVIEQDMGTRALSQGIPWEKFSGKGRVIISASDTEQKSLELEEYQHGVFTYYLLKGLQGDADSWAGEEADGIVEVDEIWNYVRKQVIEAIQHRGGPLQEPVRSGTVTAGIPLTFNRPSLEKKRIEDLYRAGDISAEQFRRAVDMIDSGEKDQMLEDFLSGDLPLEYFKEYF